MADPSPLAGLLDRAGHVFSLAAQLGRLFHDEQTRQRERHQADSTSWQRHQPAFVTFYNAVAGLRDGMEHPPDGFAPVAEALVGAARVARQIRDVMQRTDGWTCGSYLEFWPLLNSVAAVGWEATRKVTRARRLDDPLAFIDQLAAGKDAMVDTTPTLPKPPAKLIEAAARQIPDILANIQSRPGGPVELAALHLAKRLQEAGHTLAAAQWAIHEAVQAGRLRTGPVEVGMPGAVGGNLGWGGPARDWRGGGRATRAIPRGKPAPFDCFKVVATDSLWTWWRSLEEAESGAEGAEPEHPPGGDPDRGEPAAGVERSRATRPKKKAKRSTARGEGRVKLIAALTKHHGYADGGCLNQEPVGNNQLADLADVSPSTASAFFESAFKGRDRYTALCRDSGRLAAALKLLNGEFSPHHLFGRQPAGEDDRDDE